MMLDSLQPGENPAFEVVIGYKDKNAVEQHCGKRIASFSRWNSQRKSWMFSDPQSLEDFSHLVNGLNYTGIAPPQISKIAC